jgi:hypothetical protein
VEFYSDFIENDDQVYMHRNFPSSFLYMKVKEIEPVP